MWREIFPGGFLPLTGGSVLRDSLTDVYRNSRLFRSLPDVDLREGARARGRTR